MQTGIAHTGVVGILQGRPARQDDRGARRHGRPAGHRTGGLPFKSTVRSTYLDKDVGVMHACGHDVHTAALLGTASMLARSANACRAP